MRNKMKKKNIFLLTIVFLLNMICITSCNEDELLKEVPKDFNAPENSYITNNQFQMAVNNLYFDMRNLMWDISSDSKYAFYYATDFAFCGASYLPGSFGKLNDYTNVMIPSDAVVNLPKWTWLYTMVKDANVIISRLENPDSKVTEANKKIFKGEALFFRAFAYRILAHLWGGVPLVLKEVTTPLRDLTRATRDEVYKQCAADLEYGVANLPNIEAVKDGKVSSQVCNHLLSEIYISLKDYDKAIAAATAVINYPGLALMTVRFGSKKTLPGDVYSDLFRYNNQNRSSGNKEALYVIQYDYLNAGSALSADLNRFFIPYYQTASVGGKSLFAGVSDGKGGRGIGWAIPTRFFFYQNWEPDFSKDMRNSQYNIIRDVQIDNPASPYFGKWMVKDGVNKVAGVDTVRAWYPIITKVARINDSPSDIYQKKTDGSPIKTAFGDILLTNNASNTFKDEYLFRLAETYLLRAEAYIGKSNPTSAAADINVIRSRANATPITASQATLDYVLEERLRELYCEELRMATLCRLGKLVERNRKYNPYTGKTISDHHNLWPIPYTEIARNIFGKIEQNPGYTN